MAKEPVAEQLTSIWIGGIFFWLLSGFKTTFKEQLKAENKKRNMLTGYILQLIVIGFIIYLII